MSDIAIVKNIPEMCTKLYQIKHLIKITPIRTPNGLPEDGDLGAGHLNENGEFVISPRLKPDETRVELTHQFQTEPSRLDPQTIMKQCRDKWNNPW